MIKNNVSFLTVMLFSCFIVSSYQMPLIENTLNQYGYVNNINEVFTFSKNFQQAVENQKISWSSYINGEYNVVNTNVVHNENLPILSTNNTPSVTNNTISKEVLSTPQSLSAKIDSQSLSSNNNSVSTFQNSKKSTCLENCIVLMIGDSVMGDVDFSMQRLLKKDFPTWKVIDGHKVSSGLTNQTYYDWPQTAKKLVEKYRPDYVFVLLGTNDAQGMMSNGKALAFNKDLWLNEYSNRVAKIKNIVENAQSSWFWIGLPVTKDKGFNSRLQVIRDIQFQQTQSNYISVESIFGKNDHSNPINMKLRAADGIHLNSSGSDLVAKELMSKLKG